MPGLSIAVAGAGPAGLLAALLLARDGHKVTLFDQFEAPRPLGSGLILEPTGLAVLAELGLAGRIHALGRRIDRLFGRVLPSRRVVLDVRYARLGRGQFGVAVHRAALFGVLFEAVQQAAIAIETRCSIGGLDRGEGGRPLLVLDSGLRLGPFDLVVDALGVHSPLWPIFGGGARRKLSYGALWASLPWPSTGFDEQALEQRYEKASTMIGVLPIGRRSEAGHEEAAFFWSLRVADHASWNQAGLSIWKERVLRLWPEAEPLLAAIVEPEQMTLARYGHHALARPYAERAAAIGDAAHAASPQLGQGANMALLDAQALALALRRERDVGAALEAYAALRRWHVRFYQRLSALFTPFYQSDSRLLPPLRDYLIAPVTRLPLVRTFVATAVAGRAIDPGWRLELHGPQPGAPKSSLNAAAPDVVIPEAPRSGAVREP